MPLDPASCYRALVTRDARFDGRFFVGVRSTRVYCRPVCTVRTPREAHCRFFESAAAAEVAGFRPCLRCRPELAPGLARIDAAGRLAQATVSRIEDGALEDLDLAALAGSLGVTDRHLRRVFERAFGVTPIAYAQTQRLLLAKRLLTDTRLPVTDVAFASGFRSVRRFNALFRARYRMTPGRLRQTSGDGPMPLHLDFELAFRPPYDWDGMLDYLSRRLIDGVEAIDGGAYRRSVVLQHAGAAHAGWVEVRRHPRKAALRVRLAASLSRVAPAVLARVRHLFDLDCDPAAVAEALGPLAAPRPGLRLPGAFDGFEIAVRTIVHQQISVAGARTRLTRLAARFGTPLGEAGAPSLVHDFPEAARIAALAAADLVACGLTRTRAASVVALAKAIVQGELELRPTSPVEATLERLQAVPGIGPWTAQSIAMRALGWPDAFPAQDLGVLKALGTTRPAQAIAASEPWRPWRSYAVLHLWRSLS